jgi:hypothetical protein
MGGTHSTHARRRYRKARRRIRSRRGVVAVVGTLLALLVFFALFGIFLTQYVPLWMTDNESQFTSQASASFAQFKSNLDQQYQLDGPPTYGTSFTISSDGIPLLAQPTQGTLVFLPTTCPNGFYSTGNGGTPSNYGQPTNAAYCVFQNLTLSVGPGGSGPYSQHVASGVLEMVLPNRYYNSQTFYFEDDAVIQSQGGLQQIMALPPPLNVTTVAGNTSATLSFLQLFGNSSTVIGQGAQQVFSHLRYAQTIISNGKVGKNGLSLFNLTYEIGTQYPCAWQHYLWPMMNGSGVRPYAAGVSYPTTYYYYNWTSPTGSGSMVSVPSSACTVGNGATTEVWLTLKNINFATAFYAGDQITLGVGGS